MPRDETKASANESESWRAVCSFVLAGSVRAAGDKQFSKTRFCVTCFGLRRTRNPLGKSLNYDDERCFPFRRLANFSLYARRDCHMQGLKSFRSHTLTRRDPVSWESHLPPPAIQESVDQSHTCSNELWNWNGPQAFIDCRRQNTRPPEWEVICSAAFSEKHKRNEIPLTCFPKNKTVSLLLDVSFHILLCSGIFPHHKSLAFPSRFCASSREIRVWFQLFYSLWWK